MSRIVSVFIDDTTETQLARVAEWYAPRGTSEADILESAISETVLQAYLRIEDVSKQGQHQLALKAGASS